MIFRVYTSLQGYQQTCASSRGRRALDNSAALFIVEANGEEKRNLKKVEMYELYFEVS